MAINVKILPRDACRFFVANNRDEMYDFLHNFDGEPLVANNRYDLSMSDFPRILSATLDEQVHLHVIPLQSFFKWNYLPAEFAKRAPSASDSIARAVADIRNNSNQ